MFRLIESTSRLSKGQAAGFSSLRRLHSTPRRFKTLQSAVRSAMKKGGSYEVMGDDRTVHAYIEDGVDMTKFFR